jgi:mannose-6-phosphate isomerase-like protein (cupin superfamily)
VYLLPYALEWILKEAINMQLLGLAKSASVGAALISATLLLTHPQQDATPPPHAAPVIVTTPEVLNLDALATQGEALLAKARAGNGSTGITLANYKGHYTMLTARTKSGGGELHQHYADFLFVIAGEGTELTGGTLLNPKDQPDGEVRGTGVEGATPHILHKGDVIHIPAGTPHQAIEAPGQTITIYVVKVREPEVQP